MSPESLKIIHLIFFRSIFLVWQQASKSQFAGVRLHSPAFSASKLATHSASVSYECLLWELTYTSKSSGHFQFSSASVCLQTWQYPTWFSPPQISYKSAYQKNSMQPARRATFQSLFDLISEKCFHTLVSLSYHINLKYAGTCPGASNGRPNFPSLSSCHFLNAKW